MDDHDDYRLRLAMSLCTRFPVGVYVDTVMAVRDDQLHAAETAIARVRALHQPEEVTLARGPYPERGETGTVRYTETCCSACNGGDYSPPERWPCSTIRALDGEDTERG